MSTIDPHIPQSLKDGTLRLTPDEMDRVVTASTDIGVHGYLYHPDIFTQDYTSIHYQLIDFYNEARRWQFKQLEKGKPAGVKLLIIGGRGLAKSSFFQVAVPSQQITIPVMGPNRRIFAPVTHSLTNTTMHSENLRRQLLQAVSTYPEFRKLLGNVLAPGKDVDNLYGAAFKETFGKTAWVINSGSKVKNLIFPRGRGQAVRGVNFDGGRLYYGVLDDLQTPKEVRNKDLCKETMDYIYADVCNAVSKFETEMVPWMIVACDTSKGHNCYVEQLAKDPDWEILRLPVCDENYQTLAPDFMSQETIDHEVSRARSMGNLSRWAQEHMARPGAAETAPIKLEDFRSYTEQEFPLKQSDWIETMVCCDLANTAEPTSDDSAFYAYTLDLQNHLWYAREGFCGKLEVWEQVEKALELLQRYNATYLGVEVQGPRDWAEQPFRDALEIMKYSHINFIPIIAHRGQTEDFRGEDGSKAGRALPTSGYIRNHRVFINSKCNYCQRLVDALCDLPDCKDWHPVDTFSSVLYVMSKMGLRFAAPDLPEGLEGLVGPRVGRGGETRERWQREKVKGVGEFAEEFKDFVGSPEELAITIFN